MMVLWPPPVNSEVATATASYMAVPLVGRAPPSCRTRRPSLASSRPARGRVPTGPPGWRGVSSVLAPGDRPEHVGGDLHPAIAQAFEETRPQAGGHEIAEEPAGGVRAGPEIEP